MCNRLREHRERAGKSQEDVARFLGVSRPSYTRYETGDREPDIDTMRALATYFRTTLDELFGDDPNDGHGRPLSPVYDNEALELMEEMHKRDELKVLFSTSRKAKREDIEAVNQLLKGLVGDPFSDDA